MIKIKNKLLALSIFATFTVFFVYVNIYPCFKWRSVSNDILENHPIGILTIDGSKNENVYSDVPPDSVYELVQIVNNSEDFYSEHEIFNPFGLVKVEELNFEIKKGENGMLLGVYNSSSPLVYLKRVRVPNDKIYKWVDGLNRIK